MPINQSMVKIWDPVVRIGHWVLVVAFFTAYFTEDDFLTQHVWAGYIVGGIICFRLLWGFIGSKYARFSDFVRSPSITWQYLRDLRANRAKRTLGHNPAGGAMIIALMLSISGTVYSGLMLYAIEDGEGPLAGWVVNSTTSSAESALATRTATVMRHDRKQRPIDEDREEFWEDIHEFCANLALLLIGLHIAGVLFSSYAHRENLVKAMFTGRKRSGPD